MHSPRTRRDFDFGFSVAIVPYTVAVIGVSLFFGLTVGSTGVETLLAGGPSFCWDQSIKIGVIPAGACRSMYINASSRSLFLLCLL